MKTYVITEYEKSDYDNYIENITVDEIINALNYIKRGYIGDYNFTGEEDDFERYKLHMCLRKAAKLLETLK